MAIFHSLAVWGLVTAFLTYSFGSPMSGLLGGAELLMDPTLTEEYVPSPFPDPGYPDQAPGRIPPELDTTEELTEAAAITSWLTFLGVLLSGIGALLGGAAGASIAAAPPGDSGRLSRVRRRIA